MTYSYEVTAVSDSSVRELVHSLPSIQLADRWAEGNWNVEVPDTLVDQFEDWCSDHDIVARLL